MIGIICAMEIEAERYKAAIQAEKTQRISGMEFVSGRLYGKDSVVTVCGVGKVFAAMCAQTMLLRFSPDIVLNTGVAGTLTDKLGVGDIAIADEVVQYDMDTSPLGDPVGMISGINKIKLPADTRIAGTLRHCVEALEGVHGEIGTIASGDQFVNSLERKRFIRERFGAIACEMEGAAIGQVCYVNGVPFGLLRAISDGTGENSHMEYGMFLEKAAENSCRVLEQFQMAWN